MANSVCTLIGRVTDLFALCFSLGWLRQDDSDFDVDKQRKSLYNILRVYRAGKLKKRYMVRSKVVG